MGIFLKNQQADSKIYMKMEEPRIDKAIFKRGTKMEDRLLCLKTYYKVTRQCEPVNDR